MNYVEILNEAHEAGMAAGNAKVPQPMVVTERANPLDDSSEVRNQWLVPSGLCGFASVITNEHGNGKFVRHLKSIGEGRKHYYGGHYAKHVREFGQSYEQKVAYAHAYADVLNNHDIKAYVEDRLD
jgi:hypothetical protein